MNVKDEEIDKTKIESLEKSCKNRDENKERHEITITEAEPLTSMQFDNLKVHEKETSKSKKVVNKLQTEIRRIINELKKKRDK